MDKELLLISNEFKRGMINYSILLLLWKKERHVYSLKKELTQLSDGILNYTLNTIYSKLHKWEEYSIVKSEIQSSKKGANKRVYFLTKQGNLFLKQYFFKTIIPVMAGKFSKIAAEFIQQQKDSFD